MEALGRLFNIIPVADAVEVNMRDCSAVTFVCVGADTYTLQECTSAAGAGAQNLTTITHYWVNANTDGSTAWTRVPANGTEQAAAAAVVVASGVAVISVEDAELSDGFKYLRMNSPSTGVVYAITHDLTIQRSPKNLPALAV